VNQTQPAPNIYEMSSEKANTHTLYSKYASGGHLFTRLKEKLIRSIKVSAWFGILKISRALKRLIDVVGSLIFLILFSPIYLVASIAILIEDGRPLFYNQIRVAKKGRLFKMYKFRSMYKNADNMKASLAQENMTGGVIFKIKKDPRITHTGRILRKFSIDELPQLWNVFKGDLSLVGPRPPVPSEVDEYNPRDFKRLQVKPGLTCTWQVSGRSDLDFEQQVNLDLEYIKDHSIIRDIILLLKTIPAVLTGKGAY